MRQLIPIEEVCSRHTSHKFKSRTNYPLFRSYDQTYNFHNLLESMRLWNLYSDDEKVCLEQAMKLMDIVLEKGTTNQSSVAVATVQNVVSNLNDPKAVKSTVQQGVKKAVTKVAKEAYRSLEKECSKAIEESRVIKNHEMISKRFGVDRYIRENNLTNDDIPYTIYEICSFIDSYEFGVDSKYKVALEECLYALARNNIRVDQEQLIESVTDYFIANVMDKRDKRGKLYDIMESVLKKNWFVSDSGYPTRLKNALNSFDYNEFQSPKLYSGFLFSESEVKPKPKSKSKSNDSTGSDSSSTLSTDESMSMIQEQALQETFEGTPVHQYLYDIDDILRKVGMKYGVTRKPNNMTIIKNLYFDVMRKYDIGTWWIEDPAKFKDPGGVMSDFINEVKERFNKANFDGVELHIEDSSPVHVHFFLINEYRNYLHQHVLEESGKIQAVVDAFKAMPHKTKAGLQKVIDTVFIINRDKDVIHDTKNILSLIFYFTVFANALALGILPGILSALVLKIVNFHLERKYMDRVMKTWYAHRDSVHHKMEKCKDEEKKKEYETYLKEIDKNIETLEWHSDQMRGEDEEKSDQKRPKNYTKKDEFDFDFGDGDSENWDFKFDDKIKESAIDLKVIESALNSISWNKDEVERKLFCYEGVENLKPEDLEYLSEFTSKYPDLLDSNKVLSAIDWKGRMLNESTTLDPLYIGRGILTETKQKLKKAIKKKEQVNEEKRKKEEQKLPEPEDTSKEVIKELNELYYYTTNINNHLGVNCFQELSITSNLKIAADKLMSIASTLSDKEQIISRNIDGTVRFLQRSVEKAMSMENREAVIRGDILPSLSKCIKWCLLIGGAAFIHVGLAAIILVWKIAMSNKIRTKEKQMILDELEVELKLIDHHIADAEANKDYKKLKELMLMKKKLKHQNDRLRWNIKVTWKDDNVDTGPVKTANGGTYNGHIN